MDGSFDLNDFNKVFEHISKVHAQHFGGKVISEVNNATESEPCSDVPPSLPICEDVSIEKLILESLKLTKVENSTICDIDQTEIEAKASIRSQRSKPKYMLIYSILVLPLFIIFYYQNENCNLLFEAPVKGKSSKRAKGRKPVPAPVSDHISIFTFGKVLMHKVFGQAEPGFDQLGKYIFNSIELF